MRFLCAISSIFVENSTGLDIPSFEFYAKLVVFAESENSFIICFFYISGAPAGYLLNCLFISK